MDMACCIAGFVLNSSKQWYFDGKDYSFRELDFVFGKMLSFVEEDSRKLLYGFSFYLSSYLSGKVCKMRESRILLINIK